MALSLVLLSGIYALFTVALGLTWQRIPSVMPKPVADSSPMLSVVIPVRNEASTIGQLLTDLARQTYSTFEVIVADDDSTDETASLVQRFALEAPYPLRLITLATSQTASPKKRAITQSIALAQGELIVTTDGDCRVGPNWLAAIASYYEQTGAYLLSGPVTFTTETSLFDSLQTVEFSSLIGSGACTMAHQFPTMCNGANLSYRKEAFVAVGGFTGVDHLASGDDEFLMHKIASQYPGRVQFLKSTAAIVQTAPHHSWSAFYNQRKRWASKWRAYSTSWPSVLAVFIFMCNAAPLLAVAGWCLGQLSGPLTSLIILLKVVPEFVFLRQVLRFLQKKNVVRWIPLTQLIYPFYALFFGLVAQGKGYQWKGRRLY